MLTGNKMKIKRITKIKNTGILINLDGSNLVTPDFDFKTINLLFGWNGTGKTTLSRLLRCYELGNTCIKLKEYTTLECEIKLEDGSSLSHTDFSNKQSIRVFNKDFIDENLFQDASKDGGSVKALFYLGKEKIELTKERKELDEKKAELAVVVTGSQDILREKERSSKESAKVIKDSLLGIEDFQFYNISHFTAKFNDLKEKITSGETSLVQLQLSEQDFETKLNTVKNFEALKVWVESIKSGSAALSEADIDSLEETLRKSVSLQKMIEKLKNDWPLSKWVKEGLDIHKESKSPNCEFCGQTLPVNRLADLEQHFNKDFTELNDLVLTKTEELTALKLQEVAKIPDEGTRALAVSYNTVIDQLIKKLKDKQKNILEKIEFPVLEKKQVQNDLKAINESAERIETSIVGIAKELESSLVANRYEALNEKDAKLLLEEAKKKSLTEDITALDTLIARSETAIKDFNLPAVEINKDLEKFLGHAELKFESKTDTHGETSYEIKRNGEIATNLSEGEKTAISLIYFLTKLGEDGFDLSKGLVFIDDPISSMDSQFLYAAYSFIVSAIEKESGELKVGQFFLSTHNYDFLNLFKKKYYKEKNYSKEEKEKRCEAYMLRMKVDAAGKRSSNIYELDRLLKKFDSDYQYLFSKLFEFEKATEQEQNDLLRIYPYPNLARRVLETFLSFKYPAKIDIQAKINAVKAEAITKEIKESVYRFVNIQSHGGIKDMEGFAAGLLEPSAKDHILNVIKIMREEDLGHCEEMENSIKKI